MKSKNTITKLWTMLNPILNVKVVMKKVYKYSEQIKNGRLYGVFYSKS
jgi:hypothetical protein